jgi:hypothetical protein
MIKKFKRKTKFKISCNAICTTFPNNTLLVDFLYHEREREREGKGRERDLFLFCIGRFVGEVDIHTDLVVDINSV